MGRVDLTKILIWRYNLGFFNNIIGGKMNFDLDISLVKNTNGEDLFPLAVNPLKIKNMLVDTAGNIFDFSEIYYDRNLPHTLAPYLEKEKNSDSNAVIICPNYGPLRKHDILFVTSREYKPANIAEILCFGITYPNILGKHSLVSLGESFQYACFGPYNLGLKMQNGKITLRAQQFISEIGFEKGGWFLFIKKFNHG